MTLPATIDTLRTLVAFDTVSANSNMALIDWVANRLADHGVRATVQHAPEPGKANLFAKCAAITSTFTIYSVGFHSV